MLPRHKVLSVAAAAPPLPASPLTVFGAACVINHRVREPELDAERGREGPGDQGGGGGPRQGPGRAQAVRDPPGQHERGGQMVIGSTWFTLRPR